MALKDCCFCVPLRTGCILIGVFNLISSGAVFTRLVVRDLQWQQFTVDPLSAHAVPILYLASVIIIGICSAVLIVGAIKNLPQLLLPWLSYSVVSILWRLIDFFKECFKASANANDNYELLLLIPLSISLSAYLWLVVFSFYQQLIAQRRIYRLQRSFVDERHV